MRGVLSWGGVCLYHFMNEMVNCISCKEVKVHCLPVKEFGNSLNICLLACFFRLYCDESVLFSRIYRVGG